MKNETMKIGNIFSKENVTDALLILVGGLLQAAGLVFFLDPANLVSGGISGIAQVVHFYTNLPIGLMTAIGNLPIMLLGWRYLGKLKFVFRTVLAILSFSVFTDLLYYMMPALSITDDIFLNTIFGSVIMGLGFGMVYLGNGTSGGSDVIGRILNIYLGIPISQSYLITDTTAILLGAFTFGWELALYALISIYVSGVAAEWLSEGSNMFRTAMIVSSKPKEIGDRILVDLTRGVTYLNGIGGYTGEERIMIYCVINRSEINRLKKVVAEIDPNAFMVVTQSNEVLGEGFQKNKVLD